MDSIIRRLSGTFKADAAVQATAEQEDKSTQVEEYHGSVVETMIRNISTLRAVPVPSLTREDDPILRVLGEFGWWHFFAELLLFLINLMYVFQIVVAELESNLFGEYWCARPQRLSHLGLDKWKEISATYRIKGGVTSYDPCSKKNMNYDSLDPDDRSTWFDNGGTVPCTSWEYEDDFSMISEWNLACTRPSSTSSSESIFAFGGFLGSAISGYFADKKGRRHYLIFCMSITVAVSFVSGLVPEFWMYLALRGLQGFFVVGCYPILSILSMELTTRIWEGLVGTLFMYSFSVGFVICSVIAHYVQNWRHLQYSITLLSALLLFTWWFLPESPRWLWLNQKHHVLMHIINQASRMNKRPPDEELLEILKNSSPIVNHEDLKVKWSDLFRTKTVRKLTAVASFVFFFGYVAYYGAVLRLNIMFPVDFFTAYLISSGVEFAATSLSVLLAARSWMKETVIMFAACIVSGIVFFLVNSFPESFSGTMYFLIGARFCLAVLNTNLLLYVAELYPTTMRGLGIGFTYSFNFLALLVIANFFRIEMLKTGLPIFLMGFSAVVCGFLILLLPNPHYSRVVPDTIEQVEDPFD